MDETDLFLIDSTSNYHWETKLQTINHRWNNIISKHKIFELNSNCIKQHFLTIDQLYKRFQCLNTTVFDFQMPNGKFIQIFLKQFQWPIKEKEKHKEKESQLQTSKNKNNNNNGNLNWTDDWKNENDNSARAPRNNNNKNSSGDYLNLEQTESGDDNSNAKHCKFSMTRNTRFQANSRFGSRYDSWKSNRVYDLRSDIPNDVLYFIPKNNSNQNSKMNKNSKKIKYQLTRNTKTKFAMNGVLRHRPSFLRSKFDFNKIYIMPNHFGLSRFSTNSVVLANPCNMKDYYWYDTKTLTIHDNIANMALISQKGGKLNQVFGISPNLDKIGNNQCSQLEIIMYPTNEEFLPLFNNHNNNNNNYTRGMDTGSNFGRCHSYSGRGMNYNTSIQNISNCFIFKVSFWIHFDELLSMQMKSQIKETFVQLDNLETIVEEQKERKEDKVHYSEEFQDFLVRYWQNLISVKRYKESIWNCNKININRLSVITFEWHKIHESSVVFNDKTNQDKGYFNNFEYLCVDCCSKHKKTQTQRQFRRNQNGNGNGNGNDKSDEYLCGYLINPYTMKAFVTNKYNISDNMYNESLIGKWKGKVIIRLYINGISQYNNNNYKRECISYLTSIEFGNDELGSIKFVDDNDEQIKYMLEESGKTGCFIDIIRHLDESNVFYFGSKTKTTQQENLLMILCKEYRDAQIAKQSTFLGRIEQIIKYTK